MSVLRQLVLQQAAITYSTESSILIERIGRLHTEFNQMVGILPEVVGNSLSTESSNYLEGLGYSAEASDGKSLLQRIWDGIKRIAASIKQYLSRLLAGRKHHLANNQLGIEKLRHYIKNLDMTHKPTGEIQVHNTVLPDSPAEAHSVVGKFRDLIREGMETRNGAITKLAGMDFKDITKDNVMDKIHSVVNRSMKSVSCDHGKSMAFWFLVDKMSFEVVGKGGDGSAKVAPASIVLMNSLLGDYDMLVKDEEKYAADIKKHTDDTDRIVKSLESMMAQWERDHATTHHTDVDKYLEDSTVIKERVEAVGKLIGTVNRIQRLTHLYAMDVLYGDISDVLRKSLGAYKLKKHELHPDEQK